jgi:SAM-dependent methyltransferase
MLVDLGMNVAPRPYYHEFAWAYDLLQTDPVSPRIDFVQAMLSSHGAREDCMLLDAGCGTGRYAVELAKRGYQVCGVDRSPALIAVARNRALHTSARPDFTIADLLDVSFSQLFDAVLCRGVLNDFVEESERVAIFHQFARWLRPSGVLIFDVREWARTVARYEKGSIHQRTIDLPDGRLRFHSETMLDREARQLRIRERFEIHRNDVQTSKVNDFVMGCWTSREIRGRLHAAGLDQSGAYWTYGESDRAWSDRLVIVAHKGLKGGGSHST